MARESTIRRGVRAAVRGLFGRDSNSRPGGRQEPTIALPDSSWNDEDHHAPTLVKRSALDPWKSDDGSQTSGEAEVRDMAASETTDRRPTVRERSVQSNLFPDDQSDLFSIEKGERSIDPESSSTDVSATDEFAPLTAAPGESIFTTDTPYPAGLSQEKSAVSLEQEPNSFGTSVDAIEEPASTDVRNDFDAVMDDEADVDASVQVATDDVFDDEGLDDDLDEVLDLVARASDELIEYEGSDTEATVDWRALEDQSLDEELENDTGTSGGFSDFELGTDDYAGHDGDLGLSDYDDDARQTPWDSDPSDAELGIRTAREKAASILALLELDNLGQRDRAHRYLTELFEHLKHGSTYRALLRVAQGGLDFRTFQAMVELRRVWAQRPDWWRRRFRGDVFLIERGAAALTWTLAYRICLKRPEYPSEAMIDDEWFDEWLHLSPGTPGWLSFPAFIGEKVSGLDAEALDEGLCSAEQSNRRIELGDSFLWQRRLSDRYGIAGIDQQFYTHADARAGAIRMPDSEKDGK